MYEAYFGFTNRPFPSTPRVDQYYPAATIEAARQTLVCCIERATGVGLVVGPTGTGKTLLCQMLAEQSKNSFEVVLLASARLSTRRALLQAILYGLGQPYRGMDEGELRLALVDHLAAGDRCPQGMLLVVDEAHTLSLRLLDEIRMTTNLAVDGQPRTRLVLVGGPILEERFASPKLDSFNQRIVARCYLESFNKTETIEYVQTQVNRAGGPGEEVFSAEAREAVYQATDGVPRLVNQLCDHALLLACSDGRRRIDAAGVEEAWADLQQLPTPWNGDEVGNSIIEFGGLDDESDETQPADDAAEPADDVVPTVPTLRVTPESDEPVGEPVEQLERIEKTLANLDEDFQPAGSIGPEVELVFDDRDNPFDEPFEEEEVVTDRYAPAIPSPPDESAESQSHPEPSGPSRDTMPIHRREEVAEVAGDRETAAQEDEDMIVVEEDYEDAAVSTTRRVTAVRHQEFGRLFAKLRRTS